jgi:hypothetical protein
MERQPVTLPQAQLEALQPQESPPHRSIREHQQQLFNNLELRLAKALAALPP